MKIRFFFSVLLVLMVKESDSAVVPSAAATQLSCPSDCECSVHQDTHSRPTQYTVQCADQGLSDVPTFEQRSELVTQLDLSDNDIQYLRSNNTLKQFPNLQTIDVSKNQIETIEFDAFHGLDYIQAVDLSENVIMFIHPDTFSANPNLEMVNLSGNPLTNLSMDAPILNAPTITSLDLSFSQITSLTPEMLRGMSKLKTLDIRNTEITYFAYEILIQLESLVELKLDNNDWKCDDCNLLKVLNLLALRNPDKTESHEQLTCFDNNASSQKLLPVLKELQLCIEVDEPTIDVVVTEVDDDDSLWIHTIVIASVILMVTTICAALCMVFVLKRSRRIQNEISCNDGQTHMRNRNLMLAFAEPKCKRGSLEPLLSDGVPSSPAPLTPVGANGGQAASLFHDFIMSRPMSEHIYDTIDYDKINRL